MKERVDKQMTKSRRLSHLPFLCFGREFVDVNENFASLLIKREGEHIGSSCFVAEAAIERPAFSFAAEDERELIIATQNRFSDGLKR